MAQQFAVGDILIHKDTGLRGELMQFDGIALVLVTLAPIELRHREGKEYRYDVNNLGEFWTLAAKSENREGKQALEYLNQLGELEL